MIEFDLEASLATLDATAGHTQSYNGVSIWKSVDDLARYEKIMIEDRPDLVIETGTRWGGFALWLAERFGVDVLTIDIMRTRGDATRHPRITMLQTSSVHTDAVATGGAMAAGRRTMVTLDADHHRPHVVAEIEAYAWLVTPGCHLVVEDTIADLAGEKHARQIGSSIPELGGPLRAVDEMRGHLTNLGYAEDAELEGLSSITHSPHGWWRRG